MPELVINVTNIISPLCYTILKIEPYTVCSFRCVYCYSRWYMRNPTSFSFPRPKVIGIFGDFAKKVRKKGLKPIPFRLSTLVDPFPPVEQFYRVTEKVLRIALDYEYPIIINTKSVFYNHAPVKELVAKLLDNNLAVLQISISTLNAKISDVIEPRAPQPSRRLAIVKEFGLTDVPLVIRLSPYIPYVSPTNEDEVKDFSSLCRDLGVKHVIVESLRIEYDKVEEFYKVLGVPKIDIEMYSVREVEGMRPLIRTSTQLREKTYMLLMKELGRYGIAFTTCKEGFFNLHTAPDCCGVYLLKDYTLRMTLYDLYRYAVELSQKIKVPLASETIKAICLRYSRLCLEDIGVYPRNVSKALRYHEKKLLRILQRKDILTHIAPHIIDRIATQ